MVTPYSPPRRNLIPRNKFIWSGKPQVYDPELYARKAQLITLRHKALQENIPFEVEETDVEWVSTCPILNVPLIRGGDYRNSPSIDKTIPEMGYVPGNVRVISRLANMMKQNATYEQLETFSENILKYMRGEV